MARLHHHSILLILCYIYHNLQFSIVNCKLLHDPGGSTTYQLHDARAVIGKYFNYSIPSPLVNKSSQDADFHYQIAEVGTSSIPKWLMFNATSNSLQGVPLITDQGFYLIRVAVLPLSDNTSSALAQDVFAVDVDTESSHELTRNYVLDSSGPQPHQILNNVQQLSELIQCKRNEIKARMSVTFDADINSLNASGRVTMLMKLSQFLSQPLEEFSMSCRPSNAIRRLQAENNVIAAGPGDIHNADILHSGEGVMVSWPLPCATQTLLNKFQNVMVRNMAAGHFRDVTNCHILSWFISEVPGSHIKVKQRFRREAGNTIMPTPKPSQTASVITVTTLFSPFSTMIQYTQNVSTSFIPVFTTLVSVSSHSDPTRTILSSSIMPSVSSFIPSRSPFDLSSIMTLSPTESSSVTLIDSTLTTLVMESSETLLQPSPELTSFTPTSVVSSEPPIFSTSVQLTQTLPVSTLETSLKTFFQTPTLSTSVIIFDSSEFATSPIQTSSARVTLSDMVIYSSLHGISSPMYSSFFVSEEVTRTTIRRSSYISSLQTSSLQVTGSTLAFVTDSVESSSNMIMPSPSIFTTHIFTQQSSSIVFPTFSSSILTESSKQVSSVQGQSLSLSLFLTFSSLESDTIFSTTDILPSSSIKSRSLGFQTSSGFLMSSNFQSTEIKITSIEGTTESFFPSRTNTIFTIFSSLSLLTTQTASFSSVLFSSMTAHTQTMPLQTSLESSEKFVSSVNVIQTSFPGDFTVTSFVETSQDGTSMSQIVSTETPSLHSQIMSVLPSSESYVFSVDQTQSIPSIVPASSLFESSLAGLETQIFSTQSILTFSRPQSEIQSTDVSKTSVLSTNTVSLSPMTAETSLSSAVLVSSQSGSSDIALTSGFELSTQLESVTSMVIPSTSGILSTSVLAPSTPKATDISTVSTTGPHFSYFSSLTRELPSSDLFSESSLTSDDLSSFSLLMSSEVSPLSTFLSRVSTSEFGFVSQSSSEITYASFLTSKTIPTFSSSSVLLSQSLIISGTSINAFTSESEIILTSIVPPQTLTPSFESVSSHYGLSRSSFLFLVSVSTEIFSESAPTMLSYFPITSTSVIPMVTSTNEVSSSSDILSSSEYTSPLFTSVESTSVQHQSEVSSVTFSSPSLFFSEIQSGTQTAFITTTSASLQSASSYQTSSSFELPSSIIMSSFPRPDLTTALISDSSVLSSSQIDTSETKSFGSSTVAETSYSFASQTPHLSSFPSSSQFITFSTVALSSLFDSFTSSLPSMSTLAPSQTTVLSPTQPSMSTPQPSSGYSSPQIDVSSSEPIPSSTFVIASSPTISVTPSASGTTPVLSSLPASSDMTSSAFVASSSQIRPTRSFSSEVNVVSTAAVTTSEPTTQPPEVTTEHVNQSPILQHPIDEIVTSLGDVLQFPIPEETFIDPEDGLTSNLTLALLTGDSEPVDASYWLQLDNAEQKLIGVSLDSNLTKMSNAFLLSATDSDGLVAYEAFVVKVEERLTDYTHQYRIILENVYQNFIRNSQNIVIFCEALAKFLGDTDTSAISVSSVMVGSVVVSYSNKTISRTTCDTEGIDSVLTKLAYSNGTPTDAFQDSVLPNYNVVSVERILLSPCVATTLPPATNSTQPTGESNLLLITVIPAVCVALFLLLCFIIICCFYKRKRGGEEFLLRDEKRIYAKNRKPIYLDGELGDEPRGVSNPVILPEDIDPVKASQLSKRIGRQPTQRQRPPPPQYRLPDYARINLEMNDFEDDVHALEPPKYTSQPMIYDGVDGGSQNGRPPPLYRLPPPYHSQDIGLFDDSEI